MQGICVYCPVGVKFCVIFRYIMLLGVCEFLKSRCREGPSFLMGVNKNYFESCTTRMCDVLKAKYAIEKSLCCVMSAHFTDFVSYYHSPNVVPMVIVSGPLP